MVAESLTETLRDALTLAQAAHLFSPTPSIHAMWRWATRGTGGVRLQTWKVGGRKVTTRAAVERFLAELNREQETEPATDFARRAREENRALAAILG